MDNFDTIMLSQEELDFLKETFYVQATEMTEQLTEEVLALEANGCKGESLAAVKRFFHTLKGDSSTIGLKEVADLIHRTEDLLGELENKAVEFNSGVSDLLLKVIDEISGAVRSHKSGEKRRIPASLKKELAGLCGNLKKALPFELSEYEELLASEAAEGGKTVYSVKAVFSPDCQMKSAGALMLEQRLASSADLIRVCPSADSAGIESAESLTAVVASARKAGDLKRLYLIPGVVGEVSVEPLDPGMLKRAGASPGPEKKAEAGAAPVVSESQSIRVRSEKIDQVMDLVGELVTGRSMIEQLVKNFERRHPKDELVSNFQKANTFIGRSLTDLQRSVMSIRMVPVEKIFKKFNRMVRDLARAGGKEIDLVIEGEHTEVDKALVDAVGEPLLHLLRNAADHGIETPAEREAAGKKRAGTIRVVAYHRDNDIVIRIEDDGRGMDASRILDKAVRTGVISAGEAERLDEKEALGLIFLPGFSTAERISDVSGRGVGMNIVKEVVTGLRGELTVKSEAGAGTAFTLKFPMTLSIIRAILVRIGEKLYALPMSSVVEITRAFSKDVSMVSGVETVRNRNRVLPLIKMRGTVGATTCKVRKDGKIFVLVLNHGDQAVGLVVDALVGEKELVVKAVDERWVATSMVSGASILGDGSVVMILNVASVVQRASEGMESTVYGKAAN